jgi:uncharacterized protein YsxB (DUF464 family)
LVRVRVELDGDGCLRGLEAAGHAGAGRRGEDLTCAAVSGLLRSVARLLHGTEGLVVVGQAAEPGRLELKVVRISQERRYWLRGVTDVLLSGLTDLREEQAGSIELKIGEEGKEEH